MITDEEVATLFRHVETYMSKYFPISGEIPSQIFRGDVLDFWADQEPGGCYRYLAIGEYFNIIPEYCFSCYKIVIELSTVLELFKMMMVLNELELPENNVRKCMVETRQDVGGTYKAFIYSHSLSEATSIFADISELVSQRIGRGISVVIKRGCSEYAAVNPDYTRVENGEVFLSYNPEWKRVEELAAQRLKITSKESAEDEAEDRVGDYTFDDYKAMLCWLMYAVSIGDDSYLQVSPVNRRPLPGLNRPNS